MTLKEMRKSKRMTCEELAAACGVSVHTIRAYERGARQMSVDTLYRMTNALGATMEDVFRACGQRREKGAKA